MLYRKNSNYDKKPFVEVKGRRKMVWEGYADILSHIRSDIKKKNMDKCIVTVDCYPGIYDEEVLAAFEEGVAPSLIINMNDILLDEEELEIMLDRNITEDRVFGVMSCHKMGEFFSPEKIVKARQEILNLKKGTVLIFGVGSYILKTPDIFIYADLSRWEIQQRFRRSEISNWGVNNMEEEFLRKYKRAFFIDWRVNDRHKKCLFEKMDYVLDTNIKGNPKMLVGTAMLEGLDNASSQPFRVVPFFDPGVWGGQWMKDVCGLNREEENFAWCFDCVPEENSLLLKVNDCIVEIPSINLVLYRPKELLGQKVFARFGAEFPIRFDFLDTMDGGNLSLQVHPLTSYIQENFGMHYTQDESYYILDAKEDADPGVYLGLKDNVDKDEMIIELEEAQETAKFDALKYVNRIPAKKHDHFLIPAGTIHCSGANTMVLEISSTPYIFTFKLWDWDRLGLDGRPRPIHIEHGKHNIQFDRTTDWIYENCVNAIFEMSSGEGYIEEHTGLHEYEFIETRRHWFTDKVLHSTNDGVNVLNLVEGDEAIIESPTDEFALFVVHYAETFIIPAKVGEYTIRPYGRSEGKEIATLKAYVRG